ncbi:polysaccharide deacetylase family protein [Haloarchaeobius litoreus]|uniref:Polysaccharide deacetylase family protein n=1 Tax=Haloarchaeobius litoreus TaxID=755306 RepID=A0ABD6DQL9_9EURY|nr:polysaccharide deacetylase family protein [Haloarchaeobius litoreus]
MGTVVLSVDAELAWGFHDKASPPMDRVQAGREGWRAALETFDEHDLPATWAVVGHLFLSNCDGSHPDIPAPSGWFLAEREGKLAGRELFCAPELVGDIGRADADHDLGIHTFSHVQFGALETTASLARTEIELAVDVARQAGFDPVSFVFPRNDVGHRAELADSPMRCYRGVRPTSRGGLEGRGGKVRAAALGPTAPPLVEPRIDEFGLVDVPASLYLYGFQGIGRRVAGLLREDPVVGAVRSGLDAAAERDGVLHLWLHPNNLVTDRDHERLRQVCELVARYRDEKGVGVETMRSVANRTLSARSDPGGDEPTPTDPQSP